MSEAMSDSVRYLATLDRLHRRENGVVYTPDAVVELVLDQEFGVAGAPAGPVLDPACGAGAFVTGIVARIGAAFADEGVDITEGQGRRRFLRSVEQLVWGIDVDSGAVEVTLREVRLLVEQLSPGPLSATFLSENIVVGNFLDEGFGPHGKPYRHIVGNPPYVPIDRIKPADRAAYRGRFTSAVGRIDLYYLFMEQAVRILQHGGSWTLITPDKFLSNRTGQALRTFLLNSGAIRTLSRFGSHSVFRDAATVPCITTWVKGQEPLAVQRHIELPVGAAPSVKTVANVPRAAFQDSTWTFHSAEASSLLDAITAGHRCLGDHVHRISAGPATGYNPAFVVDAETAADLDETLVHPTVRGRDVGRFMIGSPDRAFMVIPYVWDADGKANLVDLDEYPRTRRWLEKHRGALEARHAVRKWGKAWWDLHDPITLPLHRTEKLLVPDVARRNRFAVDPGKCVPQHSAYYLLPDGIDADVLAAVLNSAPVELVMRSIAPLVKDGFSRYRRQYLLQLPIPVVPTGIAKEIREASHSEDPEVAAQLAGTLFNVDPGEVLLALDQLAR